MSRSVFRSCLLAAALASASGPAAALAPGHVVVHVGFNTQSAGDLTADERRLLASHAVEAVRRWTMPLALRGTRHIELQIGVDESIADVAGSSLETVYVGMDGARLIYEPGFANELRTGVDPNGEIADLQVDVNTTWLRNEVAFTANPVAREQPVAGDRIDAMSALLHAVGHAIAYAGWADGNGVVPAEFASPFDRFVLPGTPPRFGGELASQFWGDTIELTIGSPHHWGNLPEGREQAHDPARGCLAPRIAKGGFTPEMLVQELMNGLGFEYGTRYYVSQLDLSVLTDLGLPVDGDRLFGTGFDGD